MSVSSINGTRQYLTFQLGEEIFAIDVANVREILEFNSVTRVPKSPEYMRGVINLRGSVVPVFDMRLKFGMDRTERTINTCIVVVEVSYEGEDIIIGALVDSVQEVFELEADQIEPAPKIGTHLRTEFIRGMGKKDETFIIILDIDKVFSIEEITSIQEMGEEKAAATA
ncbi:MAG: Chemotaxis protein CheW [Syntrophorhabdus sp. PtaB.Bin184]|jgi:purine-binding chemotaxis protein CheW|nr:MAG: Chemotaxis protein CheW [Syntrophorhabdus sp. PtaB.Bin184]